MKQPNHLSRPTDDHHWLALWLLLAGAALVGFVGHDTTAGGILIGAGFVWLALVE